MSFDESKTFSTPGKENAFKLFAKITTPKGTIVYKKSSTVESFFFHGGQCFLVAKIYWFMGTYAFIGIYLRGDENS